MFIRLKNEIIDLNRTHLDGSPIYNLDTKENVIKAYENKEERDCYYIENDTIYGYWYLDGCIWEEHIIKQSDNIEELCNAIFYYDCDLECEQVIWLKGKNVANFKRHFAYVKMGGIKDVKGAILTDKGLIFVAQMNNEGKMALI